MSGKKRAPVEEPSPLLAHFETKPESAPTRANGARWPLDKLLAAERRAAGVQWVEVAALVGKAPDTCRHWTRDPEFVALVEWYEERLLFARREVWLREELLISVNGLREAHKTFMRIMRGDPDASGARPSPELQLRAAREYFEAIGYSDAKRLIARAEVAEAIGSTVEEEEARTLDAPKIINIGIAGV